MKYNTYFTDFRTCSNICAKRIIIISIDENLNPILAETYLMTLNLLKNKFNINVKIKPFYLINLKENSIPTIKPYNHNLKNFKLIQL